MSVDAETVPPESRTSAYARRLSVFGNTAWDIDHDVLRGRTLDFSRRFLPDGLSLLDRLEFLTADEALLLSQLQGRTYAATLALLERFISASVLLQTRSHVLGDQNALASLVRFASEEMKHQELFRRLEHLINEGMPPGYVMAGDGNAVVRSVLDRSAWSILALSCQIELVTQAHYEQAFEPRNELCPVFKDVFRFHSRDERQHVLLDELEWTAEHTNLSIGERDQAVADFIALLATLDGVLQTQSQVDARYFRRAAERRYTPVEEKQVESTMLAAYRWQFIVSGMQHVHFRHLLTSMATSAQCAQILTALQPVMQTPHVEVRK